MAVVGRHVVGDVIAQVDAQSDVSLQLQWTTRVVGDAPPYDVPIVGRCHGRNKRSDRSLKNVKDIKNVEKLKKKRL